MSLNFSNNITSLVQSIYKEYNLSNITGSLCKNCMLIKTLLKLSYKSGQKHINYL